MNHRPSLSDEPYNRSSDLFRARLDQVIRSDHPLVPLADAMSWDSIVEQVADLLPPTPRGARRASLPIRMMIGLLYLKYAYNLSDDHVLERWQATGPTIGHLKANHRMRRNSIKGCLSDATNPVLAAVGFNIRCLMRWLVVFWRWMLCGILRSLRQSGLDWLSNLTRTTA